LPVQSSGIAVLALAIVVCALARIAVGPVADDGAMRLALSVPTGEVLALRVGAVGSAALLGAALGLSGLALQTLLRNPLASPFVLGVSSGAGFGVALVLAAGYLLAVPAVSFGGEVAGAVVGALATLALVSWLGRGRAAGGGGAGADAGDPTTLVLSGVIVGSIFSAGTMLVEQLVPYGLRGDLLSWMAGRLPEIPSRAAFWTLAAAVAGGALALASQARALDVAALSDDEAASTGVDLRALRRRLFQVGGVLAAVAVAYAGPIGFVGLIGPHLARRLVGASHARLVPAAALAGAAILVAADAARQVIDLGTGRLPVGVVTALAGGPVFLWLLRSGRWNR
jgi:iron complex transport system permease protein